MLAGWWASRGFRRLSARPARPDWSIPVRAFGAASGHDPSARWRSLRNFTPSANGLLDFLARDAGPSRGSAAGQLTCQQQDHEPDPPQSSRGAEHDRALSEACHGAVQSSAYCRRSAVALL